MVQAQKNLSKSAGAESALKVHKLTFWEAAMIIVGLILVPEF